MAHSFIAYVDESGDDGLPGHYRQAGARGGASKKPRGKDHGDET
jgi:hypothetical protein